MPLILNNILGVLIMTKYTSVINHTTLSDIEKFYAKHACNSIEQYFHVHSALSGSPLSLPFNDVELWFESYTDFHFEDPSLSEAELEAIYDQETSAWQVAVKAAECCAQDLMCLMVIKHPELAEFFYEYSSELGNCIDETFIELFDEKIVKRFIEWTRKSHTFTDMFEVEYRKCLSFSDFSDLFYKGSILG